MLLTPIGSADLTVTVPPVPQVLAGTQFSHGATVQNSGAEEATAAVFTASAATGLTIVNASAGDSGCTVTPSSATCSLGTIGGGAARSVTLTLLAPSPGSYDLAG